MASEIVTSSSSDRVTPGSSFTEKTIHSLGVLIREPLVHFLAIGAVLFAVNAVIAPPVSKDKVIEVTPETRQRIVDLFKVERLRDPKPEEIGSLIDLWVLNEITYREALAQGLDKGDEMIRERIMQKLRLLIFSNVSVKDPTDTELQEYLDSQRTRYDAADLVSFFEVPVGGPEAEAEAKELLRQVDAGEEPEEFRLKAHVFAKRPRHTVAGAFGNDFTERLVALPRVRWSVLQSTTGWHIVRVDNVEPGRRLAVDEIKDKLIEDMKQARIRAAAVAAIREMGKSYVIRRGDQP
jgi:PPIC-type PPIASE domain